MGDGLVLVGPDIRAEAFSHETALSDLLRELFEEAGKAFLALAHKDFPTGHPNYRPTFSNVRSQESGETFSSELKQGLELLPKDFKGATILIYSGDFRRYRELRRFPSEIIRAHKWLFNFLFFDHSRSTPFERFSIRPRGISRVVVSAETNAGRQLVSGLLGIRVREFPVLDLLGSSDGPSSVQPSNPNTQNDPLLFFQAYPSRGSLVIEQYLATPRAEEQSFVVKVQSVPHGSPQFKSNEREFVKRFREKQWRCETGWISDFKLKNLISAAPMVWIPYRPPQFKIQPSSVVAHCIRAGTPFICERGTWAGELLDRVSLSSYTYDGNSLESVLHAHHTVMDNPEVARRAFLHATASLVPQFHPKRLMEYISKV